MAAAYDAALVELMANGTYTQINETRQLYFVVGGWVSGNGTCSGNNVTMPTY